jgi:hypothetical protein
MELLAFAAAVLVVLAAPGLAAVSWQRSQDSSADSVEMVAVGYGGIAVAALSLWVAGELLGMSWRAALFASLAGSLVLWAPALARLVVRLRTADPGVADAPLTGQYDGRVVPDAGISDKAPALRVEAPASNAHFAVLTVSGALFALLAYVPFLTYGWQRPDGIHRMAMTDWYKHLATTTALGASDVFPPANPFLHAADSAPYYYGFHLVASSIARLAGSFGGPTEVGALTYPALLLLTLMAAAATPFVAYTAARTIAIGKGDGSGDAASVPLLAALGATFLAGFDLIPLGIDTALNIARGGSLGGGMAGLRAVIPSTHLDYWIHHNERQFSAPYLTTIWAPQHMVAVLVALLAVHLILRRGLIAERTGRTGPFGASWLLPALLLAGLPALSAYVALGLAAGVAGAVVFDSLRRRCLLWQTPAWQLWLLPGLAAVALSLPVVALLGSGSGTGLTLQVSAAGRWVNGAVLSSLFGANRLTNIADSVAVYVVELGILGLLALFEMRYLSRKKRLSAHQTHVAGIVASILIFVTFIRPPVGGPNNLYARPLVLAWFLLAPFAAMRLARITGVASRAGGVADGDRPSSSRARRGRSFGSPRWTAAAILLCLLANGYALLGVVLEGSLFWATPVAAVEVSRWVNDNTPGDAVVAIAPDDFVRGFGYWLRRPMALADERHALLFGATAEEYERVVDSVRQARTVDAAEVAAAALAGAAATYLVIDRGGGPLPAWLAALLQGGQQACFSVAHESADWIVVERITGPGCR